ncbi:MAG: MarR family transcriptional regulator [Candidatus Dormibacteraeota bacterium]|nr:MarR family transcriptional regulator [Candidatus Dormibacteraeota bacterium]
MADSRLKRQGDSFEEEFPGASRSASDCSINLARTGSLLLAELTRRRRPFVDISVAAFQVLAIIEGEGTPLPPSIVAERMVTTTGTMTSLIDTLVRRGLVRRLPHPDDRRMLLIDITDAGRDVVDQILPVTHRVTKEMFQDLSEPERQQLLQLLARVQRRVDVMRNEAAPTDPPQPRNTAQRSAQTATK